MPGHLQLQQEGLPALAAWVGPHRRTGQKGQETGLQQVCAKRCMCRSLLARALTSAALNCSAAHYLIMRQFDAAIVELKCALANAYVDWHFIPDSHLGLGSCTSLNGALMTINQLVNKMNPYIISNISK